MGLGFAFATFSMGFAVAQTTIVVDNADPGNIAVEAWKRTDRTSQLPFDGTALTRKDRGSYTFIPKLAAGTYKVFQWWIVRTDLSFSVPVTIQTMHGPVVVGVNQSVHGGTWNLLGTFDLNSTTSVRLDVVGSRPVCADAVLFELVPPTPPAAPSGLLATAGTNSINLDWANNTESDLASYSVYRSTTSGSGYAVLASGLLTSNYSDPSALIGITYYYVINARDSGGNVSPYSAEASARIPVPNPPPAAPTGLAATAGNASVRLTWTRNIETDLSSYSIYRSTTSGAGYARIASGVTLNSYTDGTVTNGITYYYVLTAVDTAGNASSFSAQVSAVPQATLPVVRTIAWNWPTTRSDGTALTNLSGFKVYQGASTKSYSKVTVIGLLSQYTLSLPTGTYYLAVTAYDLTGKESTFSNEVVIVIP